MLAGALAGQFLATPAARGSFTSAANCSISSAGGTITIFPDGTGETLAEAGATIQITVRDDQGLPVAGLPASDIWLDDLENPVLATCGRGIVADAPTAADGSTVLSGTIAGGGYTGKDPDRNPRLDDGGNGTLTVVVLGHKVVDFDNNQFREVKFKSPDLSGDLRVDLSDVLFMSYDVLPNRNPWRSDFDDNGRINLSDVATFSEGIGKTCP